MAIDYTSKTTALTMVSVPNQPEFLAIVLVLDIDFQLCFQ